MRSATLTTGAVVLAAVIGATLLAGCGEEPKLSEPAPRTDQVVLTLAGRPVTLELAITPGDHGRGLMGRTHMTDEQGMLFVYRSEAIRRFWMRDTLIPLDILFLDSEGVVINIEEAAAGVEKPGFVSRGKARAVIELNRGWCAGNGLVPGNRIEIPPEVLERAVID